MHDWIDLHALAKIVAGGLICGAGLPAVFALGLRTLYLGAPGIGAAEDRSHARVAVANPAGIAGAVVCFALVLAATAWGIYWIVSS